MKKALECIRFFVVSPEFVVLFAGLWAATTFRSELRELVNEVQVSSELIRHIALLPSALATWVFLSGKKILFPDRDSSALVQQWPDYWKLAIGFGVSATYSALFAAVGVVAWAMNWTDKDSLPYSLLAIAVVGASCTFISVYVGQLRIAEILGQK